MSGVSGGSAGVEHSFGMSASSHLPEVKGFFFWSSVMELFGVSSVQSATKLGPTHDDSKQKKAWRAAYRSVNPLAGSSAIAPT